MKEKFLMSILKNQIIQVNIIIYIIIFKNNNNIFILFII